MENAKTKFVSLGTLVVALAACNDTSNSSANSSVTQNGEKQVDTQSIYREDGVEITIAEDYINGSGKVPDAVYASVESVYKELGVVDGQRDQVGYGDSGVLFLYMDCIDTGFTSDVHERFSEMAAQYSDIPMRVVLSEDKTTLIGLELTIEQNTDGNYPGHFPFNDVRLYVSHGE